MAERKVATFDKYDDEKFFELFMTAVKETYDEYCVLKQREEKLSGYSEPMFEDAIDEAEKRIKQLRKGQEHG